MSAFFLLPLFCGFLSVLVGAYDIHRGNGLGEGETAQVGLGTYIGSKGFFWRGILALVGGVILFIFTIWTALYL
jgi:hypothetical protein